MLEIPMMGPFVSKKSKELMYQFRQISMKNGIYEFINGLKAICLNASKFRLAKSVESNDSFVWCYIEAMQTFTANEAKTQFGHFIDVAQREPVRVMRRERVVGVMVSAQDYEAMRAFYANRLQHTLVETAAQAERAGMTPELLEDLLRDES
jgi:prevent-host-death family protein